MRLWTRLMQWLLPRRKPEMMPPRDDAERLRPSGILSSTRAFSKAENEQLQDDWKNRTVSPEQFAADHGMKWERWVG